ncbi:MAG: hypothetical protein ACOCZ5_00020 [bacterium]
MEQINFKKIREQKENVFDLKKDKKVKSIIKEHLMLREGLSDNALISLIVYYNGYELNEDHKKELKLFKYLDSNGDITEEGKCFIEENNTIDRLKKMVE